MNMLPNYQILSTDTGQYLTLLTDTVISTQLRTKGSFESHLSRIAEAVFGLRGGGVLVDIGANIGTFSVPVAKATGCEVHAFEAQRVISQVLAANFVLNRISDGHVHHVMLAPERREDGCLLPVPDYGVPGNFGAYSVVPELYQRESLARMKSRGDTERVNVAALDDFGLDDVFLIKIDVEGAEIDVLRGSVKTIEESGFPPLIFEAWRDEWWVPKRIELLAYVESLGYVVQAMDENFFAQHKNTPAVEFLRIKT